MSQIADNVRKDLLRLVPSSLVGDISCFVFYDFHPKDAKNVDITICTTRGEVKEFYQRELVQSTSLESSLTPTEIGILRNSKSELFYYVVLDDELLILSRKDTLKIHQRVTNIESFDVNDTICGGLANLKIVRKDDAVPLIFDEDFVSLSDRYTWCEINNDNSVPLLIELMRKLSEARFSYETNKKAYETLVNLRHKTAFATYKQRNQHTDDAIFDSGEEEAALQIKTQKPWVKMCNEKIVIGLDVQNTCKESIEDIQILLHGTSRPSLIYTTKFFIKTTTSPFWREKKSQKIKQNEEIAIVVTIDVKELKYNVTSKIEFNTVIVYKKQDKECMKSVEDVEISALDTMGPQFDVLSTLDNRQDSCNVLLAVLATTEKTELCLRHIKGVDDSVIDMQNLFCHHLQMEQVTTKNIIVHRRPYHILNGLMVVFEQDDIERIRKDYWTISLYTRSPAQVLAFIHYIHDAIPHRIIVTTTHQKLSPRTEELLHYDEELSDSTTKTNYLHYGASILNQIAMLLEYLDNCMIKMNASKNAAVQSKVGSEIDLFVGGVSGYLEFRDKMMKEARKGVESVKTEVAISDSGPEGNVYVIE